MQVRQLIFICLSAVHLLATCGVCDSFILYSSVVDGSTNYERSSKILYRYLHLLAPNEKCEIISCHSNEDCDNILNSASFYHQSGIILGTKDDYLVRSIISQQQQQQQQHSNSFVDYSSTKNDSHAIHFIETSNNNNNDNIDTNSIHALCVGMSSDIGTNYCIFSLLELIGIRFHIHSDSIPSHLTQNKEIQNLSKILLSTISKHEWSKHWLFEPLFYLRGIQPFHDFAEGPDWWDNNEYKLYSEQIYKMKMNFMGFHTYPVREPLVWTGIETQFNKDNGNVNTSYPSSWMTTLGWVGESSTNSGGDWGGIAMNTTNYVAGSSMLYPSDCYSNDIQQSSTMNLCPFGNDQETENQVFNNAGVFLNDVFSYAKLLYIQTCVGTETPLTKPPLANANDYSTQDYYQGIFSRINASYPIDYYWLWTPEEWEWTKVNKTNPIVNDTINDILTAYKVLKTPENHFNFELATCGWVLGPLGNRTMLDYYLPKDVIMSSIEMDVGWDDPDPGYGNITDRLTWSIPWMEDDPGLTALELWVNRTLSHIIESNEMGVDGIFGIHWRTQEIYAQLSALAMMTWNISSDVYGHSHNMFTISSKANRKSDRTSTSTSASSSHSTSAATSYSLQYWMDFVCSEFGLCGTTQGDELAQLLDGIDSFNLPRQKQPRGSDQRLPMQGCPGILAGNTLSWTDIEANWTFVDDILGFSKYVNGSENEYRFNYWSHMFLYFRMMGKVSCDWGQNVTNEIVNDTLSMVNYFMAAMESKGSMGTLTNIQQQLLPKMAINGKMSDKYTGVTRMFVLSPRTLVFGPENGLTSQYQVNLVILSQAAPDVTGIKLYYKTFDDNENEWMTMNMTQMSENRQIYSQQIEISDNIIYANGFDFYVTATADGQSLKWPASSSLAVTVL